MPAPPVDGQVGLGGKVIRDGFIGESTQST